MPDFATLLRDARTRKGLTQAEVAIAAGLTPSYLSFIENRKKPPPSDDVCRRLARALGIAEQALLEVAHLERAPAPLRNRLRSMATAMRRERQSATNVLRSLLSPFLSSGPPGLLEGALDTTGMTARRRKRLREVLGAVSTGQSASQELNRLLEALTESERAALLEALPRILSRRAAHPSLAPNAPPAASAEGSSPFAAGALPASTPILYAPPRHDRAPPTPYLLAVTEGSCIGVPQVEAGDLVLVDAQAAPRVGDLLVFIGEEGPSLRRLGRLAPDTPPESKAAGAGGTRTAREGSAAPPRLDGLDSAAFAALWRSAGAGVVIELRRRMRRATDAPTE